MFVLFFVVPLALVVVVSFWNSNDYELVPAFTLRSYVEMFEGCCDQTARAVHHLKTYLSTLKFCFIVWLITLVLGFTVAYFLAFHVRSLDRADRCCSPLHDAVLDLQRHPHDLVGAAARPQRPGQPGADQAWA